MRALAGSGFTATPPVPSGGLPQWEFETAFSASKSVESPLALIVNGAGSLKPCSVSVAPGEATTTLEAVLTAAEASSTPAGCVTGFSSEGQAITQLDGSPSTPAADWQISIDGGESPGEDHDDDPPRRHDLSWLATALSFLTSFTPEKIEGSFKEPEALAVGPKEELWMADSGHDRMIGSTRNVNTSHSLARKEPKQGSSRGSGVSRPTQRAMCTRPTTATGVCRSSPQKGTI